MMAHQQSFLNKKKVAQKTEVEASTMKRRKRSWMMILTMVLLTILPIVGKTEANQNSYNTIFLVCQPEPLPIFVCRCC